MRSKKAQYEIQVTKIVNTGTMPLFLQLGHQGLDKSKPEPVATFGNLRTYIVPKDILQISINKPELYSDIESIEFTYELSPAKQLVANELNYGYLGCHDYE